MKSVNRVTLLGNLGRDPEIKHTSSGTAVARISIATNERHKNKSGQWEDRTEWHNVILWARLAEVAAEYLKKGGKVYIDGRLETRSYVKDDENRKETCVVANELVLLGSRDAEKPSSAAPTSTATPNAHGVAISDEDIPF